MTRRSLEHLPRASSHREAARGRFSLPHSRASARLPELQGPGAAIAEPLWQGEQASHQALLWGSEGPFTWISLAHAHPPSAALQASVCWVPVPGSWLGSVQPASATVPRGNR